jgi:molybdopterin converting factor small subunit
MSVRVRIPTVLRPSIDGNSELHVEGSTVGEALREVADRYPRFDEVTFERDGALKRYLAVFLGDQDVRYLRGLETPVRDGSEIIVIPAASGGAS